MSSPPPNQAVELPGVLQFLVAIAPVGSWLTAILAGAVGLFALFLSIANGKKVTKSLSIAQRAENRVLENIVIVLQRARQIPADGGIALTVQVVNRSHSATSIRRAVVQVQYVKANETVTAEVTAATHPDETVKPLVFPLAVAPRGTEEGVLYFPVNRARTGGQVILRQDLVLTDTDGGEWRYDDVKAGALL